MKYILFYLIIELYSCSNSLRIESQEKFLAQTLPALPISLHNLASSSKVAIDLDKSMESHQYELRRARIMLKDALRTVKDELSGKVPEDVGKALKAEEAEKLKELLKQYGGD